MKEYGGFESAQAYSIVTEITRDLKKVPYKNREKTWGNFCHKRARHDCRAELNTIWPDNR